MPYQATAIKPRMMAGMFAPSTPNTVRQITGCTPVTFQQLAAGFQREYPRLA